MSILDVQPLGYDLSGVGFTTLSKTWVLQRQFHWQLFLPHIINGVLGPQISSFCQDVQIGNYSLRQMSTIQYGAFQRFYAGHQGIIPVSLTFLVPVDNTVIDFFQGWYELMIDRSGYYHPKNEYKKQIYTVFYDRSGVESIRLVMKGTFPTNRPTIGASYTSEDILRIGVSLSVDSVETISLIGAVKSAISNVVGDVARKTIEMLGSSGGTARGTISQAGNLIP